MCVNCLSEGKKIEAYIKRKTKLTKKRKEEQATKVAAKKARGNNKE